MEALSSPSPSRSLLPELLGPTRSPPTVSLSLNRNRRCPVFFPAVAATTSSSSSSSSSPIGAPILKSHPSPRRPVLLQALPNGSSSQSGAGADSPDLSLPINAQVSHHNLASTENMDQGTHVSTGLSGSRAGLFRTPISGGVHSATSAHDLPPPALAVRNLMEQARFAHLSTTMSKMHHRRAGYPFGSLVDFASDSIGHPIFSLSPLAIHTRNLLADPRCTLVVQIPGWSGLSNARVTIFGDVVPLPAEQQDWARQQYIAKHQQWASQQWGNFYYYRMQTIGDIYFIGGFGTVAWVDVKAYETTRPDKIAATGGEQNLKELNAMFSKPLKELLSAEVEIDDAALISVDSKGTDIRVRQGAQFNIQRLSFEVEHAVDTLEEAKKALQKIIKKGSKPKLQK